MRKLIKNVIIASMSINMLAATVIPASASVLYTSGHAQEEANLNSLEAEIKKFHQFLEKKGITDIQARTDEEKEILLNQYLNQLGRTRSVGAVLGAIAAAIAIGKGLYGAGRYAAMQAVSRGWISKTQYRRNGGGYYWSIVAGFGFFVANGFDDYMWDR
ncbi:MAG: hypothetical protein LBV67_06800 [Streptococcaceae bacterium]|jgi:hypothetical protein|nr:hypothetical protein [Streptococcaceae bacterium]